MAALSQQYKVLSATADRMPTTASKWIIPLVEGLRTFIVQGFSLRRFAKKQKQIKNSCIYQSDVRGFGTHFIF